MGCPGIAENVSIGSRRAGGVAVTVAVGRPGVAENIGIRR